MQQSRPTEPLSEERRLKVWSKLHNVEEEIDIKKELDDLFCEKCEIFYETLNSFKYHKKRCKG